MRYVNLMLLVMLILLQFRLWNGSGSIPDVRQLEAVKSAQFEENEKLRESNISLAAEVVDLKDGVDAVEERARNELGLIQSGEVFFQIVERPYTSYTDAR